MHFSTTSIATVSLLASSASAHLFLKSPVPITGNAIKDPLAADGSNFPCHGVAPPGSGGAKMNAGDTQSLIFDEGGVTGPNTAAHGGGSCQLSITYETDLTKLKDPNAWKVIYSIEGGCPTNSQANLNQQFVGGYAIAKQCSDPTSNGYDCYNAFGFTIPKTVPNGQATLAWTWFNNVGNREMYMNCAAIEVTGGASDSSALAAMPAMFVANLAGINTCSTPASTNIVFPNPGTSIFTKTATSNQPVPTAKDFPFGVPPGCGAVVAGSASGSGAPASASAVVSTTLATSVSATGVPAASVPAKNPVKPTGQAVTLPAPASTSTPVAAAAATQTVSTGSSTGAQSQPNASGSCAAGSVPCSTLSSFVCIDEYHFGICDYNNCAVSQPVAAGTACINGAIGYPPASRKRHLARHIHGLGRSLGRAQ